MAPSNSIILYLKRACCLMIYVSSNLEADGEIQMFGGNDLKMALKYSVKWTELANSNIGLLISKLCHSILKNFQYVHATHTPTPTPPPTSNTVFRRRFKRCYLDILYNGRPIQIIRNKQSILRTPELFIVISSDAKLNQSLILELVFPWFALTTIGHHAGAIQAPEICG